ncbi:hypothetical protein GGI07_004686 [Coemansia sp. Benny D115]|nr:hypothetical protein GGI07_004686 [Coemansia sp. Benny D115]
MAFKYSLYYIIATAALSALTLPVTQGNELNCVTSYDSNKDYFPDKVQVKYNPGFEITYKGNAKYLRNTVSDETYVLYQCGTDAPKDTKPTPADSLQVGGWTKLASVPGSKIALDSAPASAIIELLDMQDTVAASYKFFQVTSPCMQKTLAELPRVSQNFGTPTNNNRRRHTATTGPLVRRVSYDIAQDSLQWTFTTYGMSDPHSFAINPESAQDMLGKAEWIKFVAAFYNREADANRVFAQIESNYAAAKAKAPKQDKKKVVGLARYNKAANGTVIGWSIDQPQQWFVQGIADAGMSAHAGDTQSFRKIDDFYGAVSGWDVLIDSSIEPLPHGGATIPEWSNLVAAYGFDTAGKSYKSLPFYQSNAIYRSDRISGLNNATDYNEHLQVQVDVLLNDLIKIAKASSDGAKGTEWYRNMPSKQPVEWKSADECKN